MGWSSGNISDRKSFLSTKPPFTNTLGKKFFRITNASHNESPLNQVLELVGFFKLIQAVSHCI